MTPLTPRSTPAHPVVPPTADEGASGPSVVRCTVDDIARRRAWLEARLGVMVHWGISAIPGGVWNGEPVEGLAEWIQYRAEIPLADYRDLAAAFHPTSFDAREWVRTAAEAGAGYFVFTAKHHDGFAMFHSAVSDYNIVDATPFGRDVLAEIADACAEYGIMLGIYYSQVIDWEDPDAVGPRANHWDFDPEQGDFHRYWDRKALPQMRELLTNYGDIGVLWFDMPSGIPEECALEAYRLVRELQPGAVINSRLGGGTDVDFLSMDDNYFNNDLPKQYWETAATTNDTWAYRQQTGGWKPIAGLCEAVAYTVSRGGNLLLNIGPDATGAIPTRTKEQFAGIGEWMRRALPGIRGAGASPYARTIEGCHITSRGSALYLHITDEREHLTLSGLDAGPNAVVNLDDGSPLRFESFDRTADGQGHVVDVQLPARTDALPRTVELVFSHAPSAAGDVVQVGDDALRLDVWTADVDADGTHRWTATILVPGDYRVVLLSKETFGNFNPQWWADGMTGTLASATGRQHFTLRRDGEEPYPIVHYWKLIRSEIGTLRVTEPGTQEIAIEDLMIVDSKWDESGVNMVGIRIEPVAAS